MNSLESEYSFLAPTWKLPTVATSSMYPRTYGSSYPTDGPDLTPDWPLWNNTMYNSRYIPSHVPSTTAGPNYPVSSNQQRIVPPVVPSQQQQQQNYQVPGGRLTQSDPSYYQQTNNEYEHHNNMSNYGQSQQQAVNRGITYATNGQNHPPPGQKHRVQITDYHRQSPTTTDKSQQRSKPSVSNQHRDHTEENRFGYISNSTNIHDYLYKPPPDPGSYTDVFKTHQRRLQDEKLGRKPVITEYKTFEQNGGFGPTFGNHHPKKHEEKLDSERKRKTYAQAVRETNQSKLGGQKRIPNTQQKNQPAPIPKHQRAREYADTIERPHTLRPVFQTQEIPILSPILITSLSDDQRRSSLDSILSELNINLSRRSSSSLRSKRRVRFDSRDFIRRRSSTFIDLPSHIIGKGIPRRTDSLSARYHTEKSAAKIFDENIEHLKNSSNFSFQSPLNKNEKKFINSHSMMMTKNMRLPPTATVVINQTYKPSILATTSTNNYLKKTNSNKDIKPSQRLLTARSIPTPFRRSMAISNTDFDLEIKPFHSNNSSNE